ncbi:MAG: hypothetical protein SFU25_01080 [Candidatus Caenarcaniphilales bacterium]|nr:hypothetical protein [Candidatus Caenarcaniphilales bacterium]
MKYIFKCSKNLLLALGLIASFSLINSSESDVPYSENIDQIPICASDELSLSKIRPQVNATDAR